MSRNDRSAMSRNGQMRQSWNTHQLERITWYGQDAAREVESLGRNTLGAAKPLPGK